MLIGFFLFLCVFFLSHFAEIDFRFFLLLLKSMMSNRFSIASISNLYRWRTINPKSIFHVIFVIEDDFCYSFRTNKFYSPSVADGSIRIILFNHCIWINKLRSWYWIIIFIEKRDFFKSNNA